ncbi:hypothetical protein ACFJGV_12620 [Cnuibacter sp. UC19_7]|uniref:hypothetical protein n=1 Tax=Cnuibacter sp. UC19_7 TaxID=3350166 RepID=UPI00366F36FC
MDELRHGAHCGQGRGAHRLLRGGRRRGRRAGVGRPSRAAFRRGSDTRGDLRAREPATSVRSGLQWLDEELIARIERAGGSRVAARNPYWDEHGVTFADPDGYLLVLSTRSWT